MNRIRWAGFVLLVVLGCQTTYHPTLPPDPVLQPIDVNGVAVVISDLRPAWEKTPFSGRVTLYHLGGTSPEPWTLLAKETEAIVNAMAEKPARVEVSVASFRLVHKRGAGTSRPVDASGKAWGVGGPGSKNTAGLDSGGSAPSASESDGLLGALGFSSIPKEANSSDDPIDDHPAGTSCKLRATVRITFPGGREQTLKVTAIANGETDSKYAGEARSMAVKGALRQYSFQFREAVGAPQG